MATRLQGHHRQEEAVTRDRQAEAGREVTTLAESMDAERGCTEQRISLLPLLRADVSRAAPGDVETCKKALALSVSDPMKFDAALPHPVTAKLFACGALYFGKAAV